MSTILNKKGGDRQMILNWIKQPSTWSTIVALAGLFIPEMAENPNEIATTAGNTVAGLMAIYNIFRKEK